MLLAVAAAGVGLLTRSPTGVSAEPCVSRRHSAEAERSQAELGRRRAPAFASEVTSGRSVLSRAQSPLWKKEGKAELGEGHPSHRMTSL